MSAKDLKAWMKKNDVTPVDIAAALRLSHQTILNFLAGKSVYRSTRAAIERYVQEYSQRNGQESPVHRVANG